MKEERNTKATIPLYGGPHNGRTAIDKGQPLFLVGLKVRTTATGQKFQAGNENLGVAVYEPNEIRTAAFFLENRWPDGGGL